MLDFVESQNRSECIDTILMSLDLFILIVFWNLYNRICVSPSLSLCVVLCVPVSIEMEPLMSINEIF